MKNFRSIFFLLGISTVFGAQADAATPMSRYANFMKTKRIDPIRFRATKNLRGLDGQRRISGRNLVLATRGHDGIVGVALPDAAATAIQTLVELRDTYVPSCAAGAQATFTVTGHFFNAQVPRDGDATNDVVAFVRAARSSSSTVAGEFRVEAGVEQCSNADCSSRFRLSNVVDLGAMQRDVIGLIKVEWDAAQDQFLFQRAWEPEVAIGYSASDANPPGAPAKTLEVATTSACSDALSTEVRIDARVRDVWTNHVGP